MPTRGTENSPVPVLGTPPLRAHANRSLLALSCSCFSRGSRLTLPLNEPEKIATFPENQRLMPENEPENFRFTTQNLAPFQTFNPNPQKYSAIQTVPLCSAKNLFSPWSHFRHFRHIFHGKTPRHTTSATFFLRSFSKPTTPPRATQANYSLRADRSCHNTPNARIKETMAKICALIRR